ncbi:unnamed protein product, partial [Phaeothamnion confervicola]
MELAAASPITASFEGTALAVKLAKQRKARMKEARKAAEAAGLQTELRWRLLSTEFKEAIFYAIFLAVFCASTFAPRSADAYYLHKALDDSIFGAEYAYGESYYSIDTADEWYDWMQAAFLPSFYPPATAATNSSASGTANATTTARLRRRGRALQGLSGGLNNATDTNATIIYTSTETSDFLVDGCNLRVGVAR